MKTIKFVSVGCVISTKEMLVGFVGKDLLGMSMRPCACKRMRLSMLLCERKRNSGRQRKKDREREREERVRSLSD